MSEDKANELVNNFDKYSSYLKKYFKESAVDKFVKHFSNRLAMCPTGLTQDAGGYPGALIKQALLTVKHSAGIARLLFPDDSALVDSVVRVALVHDIGRLGDLNAEMYIEQDSDWHRQKLGQNYKYNEACSIVNPAHRSLYILQHFDFNITLEEWVAIVTSGGLHLNENAFYGNKKNNLIDILQLAKHVVNNNEKTKEKNES
jgi:hypothetical protein